MYTENFGFLKIETPPNKMKFNEEQRKFIVKSFARNNSATLVRRDYLLQYKISDGKERSKYAINDFIRVNNHFDRTGTVHSGPWQRPKPKRSQENVEKINEMLQQTEQLSVRKIAPQLQLSPTTVWRILRYDSKAKFYRPSTVQPLTQDHMNQRKVFCNWLLDKPEDFVQKIIWTDEKIFVLNQRPNRKNDGTWSTENPHQALEVNDRNGKKIMMFVAIVDGSIPIVHAFMGDNGKSQSVNGECYLKLLQDVAWPALRGKATRRNYWWMQDGAPPHCTTVAKKFLMEKFQERVISRGTAICWPAHSPDLNPLDFHFWGEAQQRVYQERPENIEGLIECVKNFAATYESSTIRRVAANVLKRSRECLNADGGHFQHLL